jgi:hypothetical protein
LDRTQQSNLAQAQIDANRSLAAANQAFQATQNSLDRAQQESMVRLSDSLSQSNVSKTFAANLTLQTSSAINAIQADGNLTPEAKKVAVQNAIDSANNTMQWGATFYNTTLPTIAAPGGSGGTVTPGPNAGAGGNEAVERSAAYKWALENGGVEAMYDRIAAFLVNNPTSAQITQAMQETGVSSADVAEARKRMASIYGG